MKRIQFLLVLLCLGGLVGCGSQESAAPAIPAATAEQDDMSPTEADAEPQTPTEAAASQAISASQVYDLAAQAFPEYAPGNLPTDNLELFAGAGVCSACHTNTIDAGGNDVSFDTLWRSGVMANAARDPYWQATVSGEVALAPDLKDVIEDKCATCHMPMARFEATTQGNPTNIFGVGFDAADNDLHALAMDGVSCNVCHQIEAGNFGLAESFSGNYQIDTDIPKGERPSYGPFPVDENMSLVMQVASGFVPIQSDHVSDSALCGTCHNLYTPYLDAAGEIVGEFPEQMIYTEWENSQYADTQACNACHMPASDGVALLSITSQAPKGPVGQHAFEGGNVFMLTMLALNGEELGVTASPVNFTDAITRNLGLLQTQTANLTLENVNVADGQLQADVRVESLVGHKFPAGFPSRRVWLHFSVLDADGNVVFESGAVGSDGAIVGNANDSDPASYEPHYDVIDAADQVQIYEPILGNTDGAVTTTLLRAAAYLKDNSILPLGYDSASAPADVGVYGVATDDANFAPGGDQVQYVVDLGDAAGPYTVKVELLYQSIGFRWADNFREDDTPEAAQFLQFYDAMENWSVLVAAAETQVGE